MNSCKQRLKDLAIFGGSPMFEQPLHVGQPNLPDKAAFLRRIKGIWDSSWLTNAGPNVNELEERIQEYLGVKHCIAVCNGTVGLEIATRASGLSGEVIVPSYTFVATAHALQWQGITPVFCDILPETHNIDPQQVDELITPRTTGILGVHLWGTPCDVDALTRIAEHYGLQLLFDAAHAFGCSYQSAMVGNFGRAEVFSFHATKFFNTGEGGAIVTNDDELAERVRLMVNFGFTGYDQVEYIGTNGKMSELSAALGLGNFGSIGELIEVNHRNYIMYRQGFSDVNGLRLYPHREGVYRNYQYIVLELDPSVELSRDLLVAVLWAENVRARRYFFPGCHRMEPYRSLYPKSGLWLPQTEALSPRVLCLPTGTAVAEQEIKMIVEVVRLALENAGELQRRLFKSPASLRSECGAPIPRWGQSLGT